MFRKTVIAGALALLMTAGFAAAEEMTVDEILGNYYEAIGGLEALKAIQTVHAVGNMGMGGGMEAPFVMQMKRPLKVRLEFTLQGMTGIQAYDGETGWSVMPFMGKNDPEKMPDGELDQMKETADFDTPLVDYKEKGYNVELAGKEDVDGTEAYKVVVTLEEDNVQNYFLDAEYFIPIKLTTKRVQMGTEMDLETIFGDYKEVGGVMFPHSMESKAVGQPAGQTITLSELKVNSEMDDEIFVMPIAETAAAE